MVREWTALEAAAREVMSKLENMASARDYTAQNAESKYKARAARAMARELQSMAEVLRDGIAGNRPKETR